MIQLYLHKNQVNGDTVIFKLCTELFAMAELNQHNRNKRALKKAIQKEIFDEITKYMGIPANDVVEDELLEVQALHATLQENDAELKSLNDKILSLMTDEDDVDAEISENTSFNVKIKKNLKKLEQFKIPQIKEEPKSDMEGDGSNAGDSEDKKRNVKLPTLTIAPFDGNPLQWQTFIDTFETSVDKRKDLSDVQKFQYLSGYLVKAAKKCIEG